MYGASYILRIPRSKLAGFMELEREATEIYGEHGVTEVSLYKAVDMAPKYGCGSFDAAMTIDDDVLLVGMDQFEDREHCERAMRAIRADERIQALGLRFRELLGDEIPVRILRAEFERVM